METDSEQGVTVQANSLPAFLQSLVGRQSRGPSLPPEVCAPLCLLSVPVCSSAPLRAPYSGLTGVVSPQVYAGIFKRIGLGDHKAVLGMVITKIVYNLRVWGDDSEVIKRTLILLATIVQSGVGSRAGQMLLGLDVTKQLLRHHSPANLPFLTVPGNERYRTTLYLTLSQMLTMDADDADASGAFEQFLIPLTEALEALAKADASGQLNTEHCRLLLVGVCRDLRGVAAGAATHSLFPVLFDLLHPAYLPLLTKGVELWGDDPSVSTAVLKLWMEIADSSAERVANRFPSGSPAPIRIFKELCLTIQAYGQRVAAIPSMPGGDDYKRRYKGMSIAMQAFAMAIGGESNSFLGAMGVRGPKP